MKTGSKGGGQAGPLGPRAEPEPVERKKRRCAHGVAKECLQNTSRASLGGAFMGGTYFDSKVLCGIRPFHKHF